MNKIKIILHTVFTTLCWMLLVVIVFLTCLLAGWILLAFILVGGLTPSQPIPVIPILVLLIMITIGCAWVVSRLISSPSRVLRVIGSMLMLFFIVGTTWTLSSPETAIFLARDMAWDGTDVWQVQRFPTRDINNAPPASQIPQKLSPPLFQTIEYTQNGKFKQSSLDMLLKSTQTIAFIIIKDGAIVYEGYFNGYARDSIVPSFSMAKSFTSALVGIAIEEGYIHSTEDPIVDYLPELRGKGLDGVTIQHLLTMSTGIRYVHGEELPAILRPFPFSDDSWTTDFPNLRSLALSVKPDGEIPGAAWKYNNYCPMLLGLILERTTHRSVSQYLQEKIWQPLGMEYPATWSLDSQASGFEKMEQGINARAIDYARFGILFLNNGNWNGKQVIPEKWISESTSLDPDDNRPWLVAQDWQKDNGYYKYMWWGRVKADGSYEYMARGGMNQQWIFVSPQQRVVIVHFGLLDDGGVDSWPDVFDNLLTKMD